MSSLRRHIGKGIYRFLACVTLVQMTWPRVTEPVSLRGMKPFWQSTNEIRYQSQSRELRWAEAAYDLLHNLDCEHITFTSVKECERLVTLARHEVTIYLAPLSSYGRYKAVLPDETLSPADAHDAVLVLDPYPGVSFGHVVLIFFLDMRISWNQCQRKEGIYLDNDECMHLAVRKRCRNLLERRSRRRNFTRKCEINFLPTVHLDSGLSAYKKNYLTCMSELNGFHGCPQLRGENETSQLLCDPVVENSLTCSTTHETVRTSCRVFEICDQAVLLSGGWNRLTTDVTSRDNVQRIYQLLRDNGFKRRNIKIFYANGVEDFEIEGESAPPVHSAAMKLAFRHHLQKMCSAPNCVDSLVIYLNNPALHDGTMLLWDLEGDGMAEEGEKYTMVELLADVAECSAKQVQIIVDQSYSGEIVHAVKNSKQHNNLLVFSSGKGYDYSYHSEFSQLWAQQNDTRACTADLFKEIDGMTENSSPVHSNNGNIRVTLSGAPCDVRPTFSNRELRRDYFGCQNLPTAVWLRDILRESNLEVDA